MTLSIDLKLNSMSPSELRDIIGSYGRFHGRGTPAVAQASFIQATTNYGCVLERIIFATTNVNAGDECSAVIRTGRFGAGNGAEFTPGAAPALVCYRRDQGTILTATGAGGAQNASLKPAATALGLKTSGAGVATPTLMGLAFGRSAYLDRVMNHFLDKDDQIGAITLVVPSGAYEVHFEGIEFYTEQARDYYLSRMP